MPSTRRPTSALYQLPPPTAAAKAATAVTSTTATLEAVVDSEGSTTTASFFYGTSPTLATSRKTPGQSIGDGSGLVAVSAALTGLAPGTTYYFEVVAANDGGTTGGSILSFTTATLSPPVLTTRAATSVSTSAATLNASVDPEGNTTTTSFIYGTEPNLNTGVTITAGQPSGDGRSPVSASAALTGLLPGTTYYFRVVASSAGGLVEGTILSFNTVNSPTPTPTAPTSTPTSTPTPSPTSTNPSGHSHRPHGKPHAHRPPHPNKPHAHRPPHPNKPHAHRPPHPNKPRPHHGPRHHPTSPVPSPTPSPGTTPPGSSGSGNPTSPASSYTVALNGRFIDGTFAGSLDETFTLGSSAWIGPGRCHRLLLDPGIHGGCGPIRLSTQAGR